MNFEDIISISGYGQLFKISAKTKFGLVAENIVNSKKIPVYNHYNVSTLQDISIYTEKKEMSLKDVLEKIHTSENGAVIKIDLKDAKILKGYFQKILPDYDKEKVFVSDIKKVIKWYNQLTEAKLLDFSKEESKKKKTDTSKTKQTAKSTTHTKPKPNNKKTTSTKKTTTSKQNPPQKANYKPTKK